MWLRNLLFLGLVGGAVTAFGAGLLPPRLPKPLANFDASAYHDPEFRAVVKRVDAAFRQEWDKDKLRAAPPAPTLTVARRLALGLMSTIPSLQEVRQIEALPEEQRLPWWIDHILEDPRFADNFAERFARAYVGTEDGPFVLYRRRRFVTWLADQFSKNRRYDHIVRDLIADEGLWTDKPATNFISVTLKPNDKNQNQPDPVRLAGRVTRAFLGLRLDCAECHDHPYKHWKKADFRGLAAFFGQAHLGFTGIHDGEGEYEVESRYSDKKKTIVPRVPFAPELLPEEGSRRGRLACWVTAPKNPYFARATVNRVWALLAGRPLVEPVDNLESDTPAPAALDVLAEDFVANGFDLRRLIRVIASTEVFRKDSAGDPEPTEAEKRAWAAFPLSRLRPEQVVGAALQSASVSTLNAQSHILFRLIRAGQRNDFLKRYGDSGEDEFESTGGTIPQRLVLMNGQLIREKLKDGPFNAAAQFASMAPNDRHAVEVAYLTNLTRRPSEEETAYFEEFLATSELTRAQRLEDLAWALINSTEFSWNH
jgi:hypothetical protein